MSFKINDRVRITEGKYKGKTGKVYKLCSVVFAEYIRITFDLKGRERTPQTCMIEEKYVTLENDLLTFLTQLYEQS